MKQLSCALFWLVSLSCDRERVHHPQQLHHTHKQLAHCQKVAVRNCFSQIIILILFLFLFFWFYITIFLTACRGWKPSASSWSHCIPLAQTAPEIGPVFVRRSIALMQPPPSSPPFLFPRQTLVVWWVPDTERSVLLFDSRDCLTYLKTQNMKSVVISLEVLRSE